MNNELYLEEKEKCIAYIKPKNKIVIYNDLAFGLLLYCNYEYNTIFPQIKVYFVAPHNF